MKAGTATKMVLNTITTGAMVLLGKVYGNLMVDLQVTCAKLQDRGERILMETLDIDRTEAKRLLEEAEGRLKSGIVMGRLGVGREEAEGLLEEAHGRISRVVGDLK
jgi:N-acetylmuramic acid 6-phosphate etherase